MTIYYEVYPRGDKLDISTDKKPVAWFKYKPQALKFCQKYWPAIGEVIPISKEKLIELLKKE